MIGDFITCVLAIATSPLALFLAAMFVLVTVVETAIWLHRYPENDARLSADIDAVLGGER